jgi:lysophospholipase L1-like esterase
VRIAFYGDSLTEGIPGVSYFKILRRRFPQHTLLNYGQGDDTAFSLRRRIERHHLATPVDLAFVWVGTNDVPFKVSAIVSAAKRLRGKPWARTPDEFRTHYQDLLDLVSTSATKLIVVSPSIVGEQAANPFNRHLDGLARITYEVSTRYPNAVYLDLRAQFLSRIDAQMPSDYLPRRIIRTLVDAAVSSSDAWVDRLATQRGLCITVDGVHLNSRGALLAADEYSRMITSA